MARLDRDKSNRPLSQPKKQVNWLLIANILLTLGLYALHFVGR